MRILMTGAAGYIGSFVTHQLHSEGHEVIALDILSEGNREALPTGVPLSEIDVRNGKEVSKLCAATYPESVVHLAGVTLIPPSLGDQTLCFDMNVSGSLPLQCRHWRRDGAA